MRHREEEVLPTMKNKDIQEQNYTYFKLQEDNLLDEWGNPKRFGAYPQVTARVGWWGKTPMNEKKYVVNRVEVIDHTKLGQGRVFVKWEEED
jgi:hypothetical protein